MAYEWEDNLKGAIQIYSSPTYEGLVKMVVDGRRKLGKPTNYNRVYNELKKLNNPKTAKKIGGRQGEGKSVYEMRAEDIVTGIKAVFKTTILGEIVPQQEILRRAAICESCPQKQIMKGCMSCGAGKAVAALWEKSRTFFKGQRYEIPVDLKKANCGVCRCYLANMLPARMETFKEDGPHQSDACPDTCWIKKHS